MVKNTADVSLVYNIDVITCLKKTFRLQTEYIGSMRFGNVAFHTNWLKPRHLLPFSCHRPVTSISSLCVQFFYSLHLWGLHWIADLNKQAHTSVRSGNVNYTTRYVQTHQFYVSFLSPHFKYIICCNMSSNTLGAVFKSVFDIFIPHIPVLCDKLTAYLIDIVACHSGIIILAHIKLLSLY